MTYVNIDEIEKDMDEASKKRLMKFVGHTLNFVVSLLVWLLGSKESKKPEEPKAQGEKK